MCLVRPYSGPPARSCAPTCTRIPPPLAYDALCVKMQDVCVLACASCLPRIPTAEIAHTLCIPHCRSDFFVGAVARRRSHRGGRRQCGIVAVCPGWRSGGAGACPASCTHRPPSTTPSSLPAVDASPRPAWCLAPPPRSQPMLYLSAHPSPTPQHHYHHYHHYHTPHNTQWNSATTCKRGPP
jgi:hypothetical protein